MTRKAKPCMLVEVEGGIAHFSDFPSESVHVVHIDWDDMEAQMETEDVDDAIAQVRALPNSPERKQALARLRQIRRDVANQAD